MAEEPNPIDPKTGYCSATNTFHSIRPTIPLPLPSLPLSSASYAYSLFLSSSHPPISTYPALIDSTTSLRISYSEFLDRIQTLSSSLQTQFPSLSKGQSAIILSPTSPHIPILYFSLLSLGIVVSPSHPASTPSEVSRLIQLSNPVIAFANSSTAHKLPSSIITILLDSSAFYSMMTACDGSRHDLLGPTSINQSDPAAILYSSGTTGDIKGVVLTHRNLISLVAGFFADRKERGSPEVVLVTVPLFHIYGFLCCLKAMTLGETVVLMERFDMGRMLRAVEEFGVNHLAVAPPSVVALAKGEWAETYDLRSLERVGSGGAPLARKVMDKFKERFPKVHLAQVSTKFHYLTYKPISLS